MRRYFFAAWIFYLLFVIYGSLVPLNFHAKSMAEALVAFRNIRYLDLGVGSRADWVANLLLFIPLAFLTFAAFAPAQRVIFRLIMSVVIWLACVSLSLAIEFAQIFFPPRTVSLNDIIAETIGAFCGIIGWWTVGPRFVSWVARWSETVKSKENIWIRVVQLYVGILILYNVMPLDLTISPVEIFHKWKAGRVVLMPFSFRFASPVQMLYGSATDVAIWIPVAALLVLTGRRAAVAWFITVGSSALIEFLQLFVYTRVTDVTQIILAGFGAGIGVWIGTKTGHAEIKPAPTVQMNRYSTSARLRRLLAWSFCFLAWSVLLAVVFWYPYDFTLERSFVADRVKRILHAVPFQAYYYGTEFRAITEVFHKTLFFAPLGVTAAMASLSFSDMRWRPVMALIAAMAIGSVAMGIDLGRLLLPDKRVDVADWVLQVVGGIAGYWAIVKLVHPRK